MYESLLADARRALAQPDPGAAFHTFFHALSEFQARHRALAEHMATEIDLPASAQSVRDALRERDRRARRRARRTRARSAPTSARPTSRCCSPASRTRPRSPAISNPCCASATSRSSSTGCARSKRARFPARPLDFQQLRKIKLKNARSRSPSDRHHRVRQRLGADRTRACRRIRGGGSRSRSSIISAFIVVLDNTVLNVAIPTIMREFDTTLPSLEWVITGYALTFATLPHHRRPARRRLRPPPRLRDRRRALRRRLAARVDLALGRHDDPRRGDHRGPRRVADAARDARDPLDHLPRPRTRAPRSRRGARPPASRSRSARSSAASSPTSTRGGGRSASTW